MLLRLTFHRFLFYLIGVFLFSACSQESEIPFPDTEKKLVVNSLFTNDSLFMVSVYVLQPMGDPQPHPINTALIKIYCNNILIDTLPSKGFGKYVSSWLYPEKGKLYTIEVHVEGYPIAKAEDRIPYEENVLISAIAIKEPFYDAFSNTNVYKLSVTLNDNGSTIDFYDLNIFQFGLNMYDGYKHYFDPIVQAEGVIEYYAPTAFFSDHLFNGKQQNLNFLINRIPSYDTLSIEMNTPLILTKISESYYRYLRGLILQKYFKPDYEGTGSISGLDIMFLPNEVYKIYTNVENGYGIVAGFATENKEIEIREEE